MTHFRDRLVLTTGDTLGLKRSRTPEGFMLCEDVPIARTGVQEYLNDELIDPNDDENKLEGGIDGVIKAERNAEDVFRPETLASFEGKPVVDDHPDDVVSPENFKQHVVGVTLNPRRGTGELESFIVADLLIMDESAIEAIESGKREVSCGYDAEYEPKGPGRVRQYNIVGNHVALVDKGRCGYKCAIGDKAMSKKSSVFDRIMNAFKAKDEKAFKAALKDADFPGAEEEEDKTEDADTEQPFKQEGLHIHIHSNEAGGVAAGDDPKLSHDEGEEGEEEKPKSVEDRMTALEGSMAGVVDAIKKLSGAAAEQNEEGEAEGEEGEESGEEAEEGAAEENEEQAEEGEEQVKDSDPEQGDLPGKKGNEGLLTMKDKKRAKDSSALKDAFVAAKSGAEIIAPGLKMPTFDRAASAKTTLDSVCLLKRRALARSATTTDGAAILETVTGSKKLEPGMTCDKLGVVFNAVVAMTKDKNDITKVAPVKTLFKKTEDKDKARFASVKSPADFNAAARARYGQPTRH